MSLKVVLPFSLVVFGGASAATTGVYFHNQGSGKGDGTGNAKIPLAPDKEETNRKSTGGNVDEQQTGNTGGVTTAKVTEGTQTPPEQKLPASQGDSGAQISNPQQSTGPGPSPSPENTDSTDIQKPESNDHGTEESNLKTEKEKEQQDNSERSEDNDKGADHSNDGKEVPSTGEGGASGRKQDVSSPAAGKGASEISGGDENTHQQSQGTDSSPTSPEQIKTTEQTGTTGDSSQNNQNTGATSETGSGTKESASETPDNSQKDSGSSGSELPAKESK